MGIKIIHYFMPMLFAHYLPLSFYSLPYPLQFLLLLYICIYILYSHGISFIGKKEIRIAYILISVSPLFHLSFALYFYKEI